jgi:hypothetical protein
VPASVDPSEDDLRRAHAADLAAGVDAVAALVQAAKQPAPQPAPAAPTPAPAQAAGLRIQPRTPPSVEDQEVAPPPATPDIAQDTGPAVSDNGVMAPYEDVGSADEVALRMTQDRPVTNHQHGFLGNVGGALKSAAIIAGEYARAHPAHTWQELAPTVGAVGAGLVGGAVNPKLDETLQKEIAVSGATERVNRGLKIQERGARIRQATAAATYTEARPGIERDKAAAAAATAAAKREQSSVLSSLRLFRGQQLDPNNPEHAKLLRRAAAAGVVVDPTAWNDSKDNLVQLTVTDPTDSTKTDSVLLNKVTGEQTILGQKGFQATRNAEGMTTAEVKTDADRDRAYAGLERERAVSNDLRRQGLAIAKGHLTLAGQHFDLAQAQFDNRLTEGTRKELKSANDLAAEAERWQEAANAIGSRTQYKDPETGEMKDSRKAENQRDIFAARAESLRRRVVANYGYLFSPDDSGTPKMSSAQLQQLFPSVGGNWSGLATRLGVTLTDEGSGQGSVPASTLPRRGAPRAAAPAGAPARVGRFAGRRMSRANLGAAARALGYGEGADAEKRAEATIKAEGGEVY